MRRLSGAFDSLPTSASDAHPTAYKHDAQRACREKQPKARRILTGAAETSTTSWRWRRRRLFARVCRIYRVSDIRHWQQYTSVGRRLPGIWFHGDGPEDVDVQLRDISAGLTNDGLSESRIAGYHILRRQTRRIRYKDVQVELAIPIVFELPHNVIDRDGQFRSAGRHAEGLVGTDHEACLESIERSYDRTDVLVWCIRASAQQELLIPD